MSSFCVGYVVMFLLTYCPPNDRACLDQDVACRQSYGTIHEGMAEGKRVAYTLRRLELQLVRRIIQENKNDREQ